MLKLYFSCFGVLSQQNVIIICIEIEIEINLLTKSGPQEGIYTNNNYD